MPDTSASKNRVSRLVKLNDQLQDVFESLENEFKNADLIHYRGSALVNILRFEENGEHRNDGMLMFVYRYDDETDTYTLECHMEVNYRTVPDNSDRYKFAAEEREVDPLSFVREKINQFRDVYTNPPQLMGH